MYKFTIIFQGGSVQTKKRVNVMFEHRIIKICTYYDFIFKNKIEIKAFQKLKYTKTAVHALFILLFILFT